LIFGIISPVKRCLVLVDEKLESVDASEFVGVFEVNGISKLVNDSVRRKRDSINADTLVGLPGLGVHEKVPNATRKRRRARCGGLLLVGR
jgi:hypothetical protein